MNWRNRLLLSVFAAAFLLSTPSLLPDATPVRADQPVVHADRVLDDSQRYRSFVRDGELDHELIDRRFSDIVEKLRSAKILIVPSWLSDVALAASQFGVYDYFETQIRSLRAAGLDVEVAAIESEDSAAANAQRLRRQIETIRKPVCIVSHSKGGLDTLEMLLAANDRLLDQVICWIALQAPFAGSPLADAAAGNLLLRSLAAEALTALGGSEESLIDLQTAPRRAQLRSNDAELRRLAGRIPILSFGSYLNSESLQGYAPGLLINWLAGRDVPSDGLVPVSSAVLPHSRYLIIEGLDHAMTVSSKLLSENNFDRTRFLKLLLYLVLTQPQTDRA